LQAREAIPVTVGIRRLVAVRTLPWRVLFVFGAVAGLLLRIWVDRTAVGIPDSDEAVVGLMVRHALHGELTTFYWGQPYGGSQEALLTIPLFFVAGPTFGVLRVVPVALSAAASLLTWRVGKRTIGEPGAGVAALLLWIWFPLNLVHLTHQYDFYASDIVYCALLLLLGLRVVEEPSRLRAGVFGLVLGLAFWQTIQVVPIAVPLIAWMIWKRPGILGRVWVAGLAAVVGALPWIVWNIRNDWGSLMVHANGSQYVHSLRLFVSPLIPMTLGLRTPLTGALLVPSKVAVLLVYLVLLLAFAYGAYRMRHTDSSVLFGMAAVFPFVWAISRRVTFLSATPRFVIVLTPVLALLVAVAVRRLVWAVAVAVVACAISIVSVHRMNVDAEAFHPHGLPPIPRRLGPLISTLDRLRLRYVYADYWITYRLDFDSRERIVASEVDPTRATLRGDRLVTLEDFAPRYPPYAHRVSRHRHGFVFFRRTVGVRPFGARLERHGYRRVTTGRFVIYAPPA
jgi:hypothetical protein